MSSPLVCSLIRSTASFSHLCQTSQRARTRELLGESSVTQSCSKNDFLIYLFARHVGKYASEPETVCRTHILKRVTNSFTVLFQFYFTYIRAPWKSETRWLCVSFISDVKAAWALCLNSASAPMDDLLRVRWEMSSLSLVVSEHRSSWLFARARSCLGIDVCLSLSRGSLDILFTCCSSATDRNGPIPRNVKCYWTDSYLDIESSLYAYKHLIAIWYGAPARVFLTGEFSGLLATSRHRAITVTSVFQYNSFLSSFSVGFLPD